MTPTEIIILSLPIVLVLVAGFLKPPIVEMWALKFEAWANKKKQEYQTKDSGDKKWHHDARHPFMLVAVWLADTAKKHIPDPHWRSAVFLGLVSVVFSASVFLILVAVMYAVIFAIALAIAVGLLWFGFKMLTGGNDDESPRRSSQVWSQYTTDNEQETADKKTLMMGAAGKGSTIFDNSGIVGNFVGYVNEDGYIYDNSGFIGNYLGRVNDEGYIYNNKGFIGDCIGHIEKDGSIYDNSGAVGNYVGRVENNNTFDNSGFIGKNVGHVEK